MNKQDPHSPADEPPYYLDIETIPDEEWQSICNRGGRGKEEQLLADLLGHMLQVQPSLYTEEEADDAEESWLAAEDEGDNML